MGTSFALPLDNDQRRVHGTDEGILNFPLYNFTRVFGKYLIVFVRTSGDVEADQIKMK